MHRSTGPGRPSEVTLPLSPAANLPADLAPLPPSTSSSSSRRGGSACTGSQLHLSPSSRTGTLLSCSEVGSEGELTVMHAFLVPRSHLSGGHRDSKHGHIQGLAEEVVSPTSQNTRLKWLLKLNRCPRSRSTHWQATSLSLLATYHSPAIPKMEAAASQHKTFSVCIRPNKRY